MKVEEIMYQDVLKNVKKMLKDHKNAIEQLEWLIDKQMDKNFLGTFEKQRDTWSEKIYSERADFFLEVLAKPLEFLQGNQSKIQIDASVVREHFLLDWIEAMVLCYPAAFPGIEESLSGLKTYLESLPGWKKENAVALQWTLAHYKEKAKEEFVKEHNRAPMDNKPEDVQSVNALCLSMFDYHEFKKQYEAGLLDAEGRAIEGQDQETYLQHGYITVQLVRSFESLSNNCDYIMKKVQDEVDPTCSETTQKES